MASQELLDLVDQLRATRRRTADRPTIEERRAGMDSGFGKFETPRDIATQNITIDGIAARWFDAPDARRDVVMLYLHGGGYCLGSIDTHHELMARLSLHGRCRVLGVDYRLAPEFPYPAALEDALAGYRHLLAEGYAAARIFIAGDSAGGGLAVATLLALRGAGDPLPRGAVLFSPWTDLTASGHSLTTHSELDPMVDRDTVVDLASRYVGDADPAAPLISPIFGDLSGLPPLEIQVGDHEVLLDDSLRLAERVSKAGGRANIRIFEGAVHVFQAFPFLPETREAMSDVSRFCAA